MVPEVEPRKTRISIALTTASNREEADRIALALVEARLAACVNIVDGVHSTYRWKGKVEQSSEMMLFIKTTEENLSELEQTLKSLHSYEVPEMLVLSVAAANDSYLQWVQTSVK